VALVAVALLTALSATSAATSAQRLTVPSLTTHQVPACAPRLLGIRVVRTFAAGGTAGGVLGFTNHSRSRCRLSGWPTFVAIEAGGRSLTGVNVEGTMFGPYGIHGVPIVTVPVGGQADAVFAGGDGAATACPPPFRYIRVGAPKAKVTVVLSGWLPYLDAYLPSCTRTSVSPVVQPSALSGTGRSLGGRPISDRARQRPLFCVPPL
jgi:hypothetical protein